MATTQVLEGKVVVVRGRLTNMTRQEVADFIRSRGGGAGTSLTAKTDYFVQGKNNRSSETRQKARKLGIPTLDEATFLKVVEISTAQIRVLEGKAVVVAGRLNSMTRQEVTDFIRSRGGKVGASLTGKTDYFVQGKNNRSSETIQKAQMLGVQVLDEAEFLNIVRGRLVRLPDDVIGVGASTPVTDLFKPELAELRDKIEWVLSAGYRVWFGGNDDYDGHTMLARTILDSDVYKNRKLGRPDLSSSTASIKWSGDRVRRNVKAARKHVRGFSTDEERLLAAVGESKLRSKLPHGLLQILGESKDSPLTAIEIARAAIATFHTGALREYRDSLEHLGRTGQSHWAGGFTAVEFVRSLGFSEEWAGEPRKERAPYIEVDGPQTLPYLHEYQRRVVDNARNLIRSNGALGPKRGMVSMPTGSGKTRVAVQSIVEAIRDGEYEGGVLWVADRYELCEQAVEGWREVWASEGSQGKRLRISRLWGGLNKDGLLPSNEMHIVIASIQTLYARIQNQPEAYEFLRDFGLVVFDEAHRSVAPTFTSVMQDIGLTRWRRDNEPILIGLTATPYRGRDPSETRRLVNQYSSNRLDNGAFSSDQPEAVIQELQDMQVLARADHATIRGGDYSLSDQELQRARELPWLPRSVENRISEDTARTQNIIKEYFNRIRPDWPTLIFATSVEHSKTLAALLTARGVKARAVSGETDAATRRRVVEEFRSGEVKALVNYGVFREGFDAPKTRAIIVARPVYSPNLYFQMIGRGLRGVLNGGNDRCLILNVQDNIENFERALAFSELDWLWDDAP